ncbi:MAG: pitrilysin family protein [Firmicutes bacterium]|nr:pitrilysin family protein [Bacillota bacterium]
MKNKTQYAVCGDTVFAAEHESGLRVFVCPKKGYSSAYAIFGTAYGSVHNCFRMPGEEQPAEVPAGIAHFLEHKLFENEHEDAFARYARTGASANAYTSFDKTCYLFSCSQNFEASLEILLDFVQSPYFTAETVQKEQGIIGQEIRMCLDDPERRVVWNLLEALYHRNPVRTDIAGTVESIAKIDAGLLYRCYHAFYRPENMVLCVAGNVEAEAVFAMADRWIRFGRTDGKPESVFPEEPRQVVKSRVEQHFPVAVPLFQLGFKELAPSRASSRSMVETDILLELLASESSPLYRRLLDRGWINSSFGCEYFEGPGYAAVLFGGESREPDRAAEEIKAEIVRLRREGIDPETFECARRTVYGRAVSALGNAGAIANQMTEAAFSGRRFGEEIELALQVTREDVLRRLNEQLDERFSALSVVCR